MSKQCLDVQQMLHLQELGLELDYDTLCRYVKLEDTIECIKNNMSSELNNLVIAHLSDGQSDERMFADRIYDETGIMPKIASKGLIVELNKEEF